MKLMSFSFEKISIERTPKKTDKLTVNTNIEFLEIKKIESEFRIKGEFINVKFKYDILYSPDFAKINFVGNVLVSLDQKQARNLLKQFKDKKLTDEFKVPLFNIILRKANIKALQMEDEMSLPLHIRLPYVERTENEKS